MERQIISSRQNPLTKLVCGLADKKNRRASGLFRFDGIKLLGEALSANICLEYVICRSPISERLLTVLSDAVRTGALEERCIVEVSESVFAKISEEHSPEGVVCVAKMPQDIHTASCEPPQGSVLVLESVRDPGNLGTIMRSAYALGLDTLLLTDDCADIYNPRTVRAAMGAVFKMHTQSVKCSCLPELIEKMKESGRGVYAAALSEDSREIDELEILPTDCFVIGNEGHGLSENTLKACSKSVIIPMREDAESLNAAGAAVICIWETVRASKAKAR